MFRKIAIFSLIIPWLLFSGCASRPADERPTIFVSILPLRGIVSEIVGDDFRVEVLVPPGMNPESFEPTPRQMIDLNRSQLIFNIGWIDFEQNMLSKIEDRRKVIDLHRGIEPIAGSCSHADAEKEHRHGVDPHIWTSPRELRTMADNAYRAIHELYSDSTVYAVNYQCLADKLQALDDSVAERLKQSGVPYFMIYHPALTYYARAYGIEQVAIEQDGKEPSAKRLARLIEQARRDSIRVVFYQSQFPASTVEVIAEDIGAQSVRIDPLAEDVVGNISYITDLITAERL